MDQVFLQFFPWNSWNMVRIKALPDLVTAWLDVTPNPIVVAAPQEKPPNMHHKVYVGMCVCEKSGNMINVPIENLEETTYTHRLVIWLSNSIPQYYGISKSPTSWSVLIGQGSWGYKIYHLIWGNYFPIHLKVRPCLGTLTLWPTTVKALYQLYMVLNGLIIP
jgi:hypothetical protein